MKSSASLLSPPPSPHPAPVPLPSSPLTRCSELDLSVLLSPTPKQGHAMPRPLKKSLQSDQSQLKSGPRGRTGGKVCFKEPAVSTVTRQPHNTGHQTRPSQQPIRSQGRSKGSRDAPAQWAEPPAATSNHEPSCLERAELNTTLALKAELQSLEGAEFNSQKAIQERLRCSERTKNVINCRATEVVNVSRSQVLFRSLVSVDVREDQLINQVLEDRLAPPPSHDRRTKDSPSLCFFMTPDLLRQKPLPPDDEQMNHMPRPQRRPPHLTFDLYRRRMSCQAAP